jgi:hypothetical protein
LVKLSYVAVGCLRQTHVNARCRSIINSGVKRRDFNAPLPKILKRFLGGGVGPSAAFCRGTPKLLWGSSPLLISIILEEGAEVQNHGFVLVFIARDLGSSLGSTWFHLVLTPAVTQMTYNLQYSGLVPALVPLGSTAWFQQYLQDARPGAAWFQSFSACRSPNIYRSPGLVPLGSRAFQPADLLIFTGRPAWCSLVPEPLSLQIS